jgi:hypothetical protein
VLVEQNQPEMEERFDLLMDLNDVLKSEVK